jgi:hypothetical protein
MINRLVEQRQAIQLYLTRHNKRDLDLNDEEWTLIVEFEKLLKPFDEVTKILCQDSAPISLQFPLAKMIHSKLSGTEVSECLVAVREKMFKLLEEKFFDLEDDM